MTVLISHHPLEPGPKEEKWNPGDSLLCPKQEITLTMQHKGQMMTSSRVSPQPPCKTGKVVLHTLCITKALPRTPRMSAEWDRICPSLCTRCSYLTLRAMLMEKNALGIDVFILHVYVGPCSIRDPTGRRRQERLQKGDGSDVFKT